MTNPVLSTVRKINTEVETALAVIGKKYGYSFSLGTTTYDKDGGNFTSKLTAHKDGALTPEAQKYNANRGWLALPELGTVVKFGAWSYEITGLNRTGTKVHATRQDNGKSYNLPTDMVKVAKS